MLTRNRTYTIKKESEGLKQMTYNDFISSVTRGFEFRIHLDKNIFIDIFTLNDKTSVICYDLVFENEIINICDKEFLKTDIEKLEVYKYMTFKELFQSEMLEIVKMH